jgi:hypothetical protein
VPLVVVTSFAHAMPDALGASLASLRAANFSRVLLGSQLGEPEGEGGDGGGGGGSGAGGLWRGEGAVVGYFLALEAQRFAGNSVSTFTAFLLLERRWLEPPRCAGGVGRRLGNGGPTCGTPPSWLGGGGACVLRWGATCPPRRPPRFSVHYNGGGIPLATFLPFYGP